MSWFLNHYECPRCGCEWEDEWSCMCDDDCPDCGFRHLSPGDSEDLSVIVDEVEPGRFSVCYSPASAEHSADYRQFAVIAGKRLAEMLAQVAGALTMELVQQQRK